MPERPSIKENKDIIQKLLDIPMLKSMSKEDLRGILTMSKLVTYEEEEYIIREGQYDNWIYFLLSGKVGIHKQGEIIATLQRLGDLFGEMGVIDGSPRSASIIALKETTCLCSYVDRLEGGSKIIFTSILYRIFSEILANRLRMADAELVKLRDENSILKEDLTRANDKILQLP
jgi:CRP/FNR family cyclic AMP-dependent transcriptional regulator